MKNLPLSEVANSALSNETAKRAAISLDAVKREVSRAVVGQPALVERLLIGLLTGGHLLLEGVPGLAKTLAVSSLAQALQLTFRRIQFTPDLLPADVIGTLIYNPQKSNFEVKKGPVFTHLLLADEINRAPAKVQSALLEAMQERQVTIGEVSYPLPTPFLVLATRNPIDQEGTYPLPEAQLDRFMLRIRVDYPTAEEELTILRQRSKNAPPPQPQAVMAAQDILNLQKLTDQVTLAPRLEEYIVNIVQATRAPTKWNLEGYRQYIKYGAGPRATLSLALAARAYALIQGRMHATPDDVKALASEVLAHRIILGYEALAQGITTESVVAGILAKVAH